MKNYCYGCRFIDLHVTEHPCDVCIKGNGGGDWNAANKFTPIDNGKEQSTPSGADKYSQLHRVLNDAAAQASAGKGLERHACGEPFERQQIVEITKRLNGNTAAGPLFQAVKKCYESSRLDKKAAIHELYGAINYIAAAIIVFEDSEDE